MTIDTAYYDELRAKYDAVVDELARMQRAAILWSEWSRKSDDRIAQLEAALRRIAKGHNADPPWERHLYARSCDACNAQEIANAALGPCCPWCSGPHLGTDCRAERAQSDASLAPKEPT